MNCDKRCIAECIASHCKGEITRVQKDTAKKLYEFGAELFTCKTYRWYEPFNGVCCNGENEHRADFMDADGSCEKWEV